VCHGLWMPGTETWLLRRRLAKHGFRPYLYRYPTVGRDLEHNAAMLAELVERIPEPQVHLVGYSLGGIVSIYMLRARPTARVGRVVCIGSPLNGSDSARALAKWPIGRRLVGLGLMELNERRGLGPWSGIQPVGIIAGDLSFGLGRCLGRLGGANDGTVIVEETRLAGAADHVVRHVSHTGLLFSAEVAADVIRFLRVGRFN
jgi:pimeloyl-ACP methyl ester carboxylesterase